MAGKTQRIILEALEAGFQKDQKVIWTYGELYDALLERRPEKDLPRESAVRQCVRSMRDVGLVDTDTGPGQNVRTFWSTEIREKQKARDAVQPEAGTFLQPFPQDGQLLKTAQAVQDKKASEKNEKPSRVDSSPPARPVKSPPVATAPKTVTVSENYRKGFQDGWDAAISHLGFTVTHAPVASPGDVES